ncbi:MAG: TIM barrel protein [Lentisphaerae bacterium]|nr:TIM barrel protein [Lentisphaerota bacterium]
MSQATPTPLAFSLSTNWNSERHETGEAIVDEIADLGFHALELGYKLDELKADGILLRINQGAIKASSVHAFCPAPLYASSGHPELYLAASLDDDERTMATILVERSLELARESGARAVVLHAGRVRQKKRWFRAPHSEIIIDTLAAAGADAPIFTKMNTRAKSVRNRIVTNHLNALRRSLDSLLPRFTAANIVLSLENLPSWEALPDENEITTLIKEYNTTALAQWYDIGHGEVRQNLGWCADNATIARELAPFTCGVHIHDVAPPATDHLPPGEGVIDFSRFSFYANDTTIRVFEPHPAVTPPTLQQSLKLLQKLWRTNPPILPNHT